MSEIGDDFAAIKKIQQEKRADNRAQSADILRAAGIAFTSNNDGAHLIVTAGHAVVDFWPGTGLWIVRGNATQKRGVRNLLKHISKATS